MFRKNKGTSDPDPEDGIRSRCPACQTMVIEGTEHKCPSGRHRKVFINPMEAILKDNSKSVKRKKDNG